MLFDLTFEFSLNSFKKWYKRGQNWRDCQEDAAKSSRIGNQFGSGSCFTRRGVVPGGAGTPTHWDFLPKFLSLHYYTPLEGVLGVQRSGQA